MMLQPNILDKVKSFSLFILFMVNHAKLREEIDKLRDEMAIVSQQINYLVAYLLAMDEDDDYDEYEGPVDGSYPDVYDSLDSFAS